MPSIVLLLFAVLILFAWSSPLFAHGAASERPSTSIKSTASATLRTAASIESGQPGLIPGAQLGGEALPVEKGLSVDDMQVIGTWAASQDYTIQSSLMAHFYGGHSELELESFILTLYPQLAKTEFTVSLGKLTAQATPMAYWHASQSQFSEAPLLSDVFWGRHFADTGIQLSKKLRHFSFGVELWNGNSWPASGGEGAADIYLHFTGSWRSVSVKGGMWGLIAKAKNRNDSRYGAGHSHGSQSVSNPVADYFFDGDVSASGVFAELSLMLGNASINSQFEAITQSQDGQLSNANQSSQFESNNLGYRFELGGSVGSHRLRVAFEQLTLENQFYNATEIFVVNAGLLNNGFEPQKLSVLWAYQWRPELTFRSEFVADKSFSEVEESRFNLGFQWRQAWVF